MIGRRSVVAGAVAAALLLALYLGLITLAQGFEHTVDQLTTDLGFVALIGAGFGIQIALFVELRAVDKRHRAAAAVTAAGTGTSAAAMLACCAHHVADVLPLVGLSAAAVFLDVYRTPLFVLGIAMNALGVVIVARRLRQARQACAVLTTLGASHPATA